MYGPEGSDLFQEVSFYNAYARLKKAGLAKGNK